jgi:hypothetical protein
MEAGFVEAPRLSLDGTEREQLRELGYLVDGP